MDIKKATIKELKKEKKSLEFSIEKVGCFGVRDLLLLELINKELDKRGIIK